MIQQGATVGARLEKEGQAWRRVRPYLPLLLGGLAIVVTAILALIYVPKILVPDLYWLSPKVRFDMLNEARRTVAYIIGGVLAVVGIGLTIWRNWIAQEGQITERFTRAIDQLGSSEMAIRLGGIYALERIASDSKKDYWPIMETLTAFVRDRAKWQEPPPVSPELVFGEEESSPMLKLEIKPATDIRAVLTVILRRKYNYGKGESVGLDLQQVDIRGANLDEAQLERVNFQGAHLEGANLYKAHLERAFLSGAHLEGANLMKAHLEKANLTKAHLEKANFYEAHLEGAHLWGATGLTWEQLDEAIRDDQTNLPGYLEQEPQEAKGTEGNDEE